jgi:alpha-L-arabinofuranosidase
MTADSSIRVDAGNVANRVTPLMYGACIEDVNHEIYGGLYAQMIFGESFEEPPRSANAAVKGWTAYGGKWSAKEGAYFVEADRGAKSVRDEPTIKDGSVECEVKLLDAIGDNAGLILRVQEPRVGADSWIGYEVSLSARGNCLRLGRHRNNWHHIKDVPAAVEPGQWVRLRVELAGPTLRIFVREGGKPLIEHTDADAPILEGKMGLRTWGSNAAFRNLVIKSGGKEAAERFDQATPPSLEDGVSGMWDVVRTGTPVARFERDKENPFNTAWSQRIEMAEGAGTVGVANRGLNRSGLTFREGREYTGRLYLRQRGYEGRVSVALQSADGSRTYAQQALGPIGADWTRYDFSLKPNATDTNARFAVWSDRPGTVWVDQVYLSGTGDELFKGLPFRADIAKTLQTEGLTMLRYGGSMVNAAEYRWKKMVGDRDRRSQYRGTWYPHSTNGFGIEDFVQFCQAAGFECVFAINIEETPQDAAGLVDYLNSPVTTEWGRRRAENGHPEPYNVKYIQIGNEEGTNAHYLERFKLLYDAMRPRDPKLQFIIACWWEPDKPVTKQIVQELNGKAALWDVHVGGDGLRDGDHVDATFTRMRKLVEEWAPGTALKACVLEENGGRHDLQRALGHAHILNTTQRHGDFVLMDCPANCLQPWKQNDNGWDQGQVFFTSGQVWGMPPFYAQQMAAANHLPLRVASEVASPDNELDLTATRSEDGSALVLKVVNVGAKPHRAAVQLSGFGPIAPRAEVWTLSGKPGDINTPEAPERIRSQRAAFDGATERFAYGFPAYSYTILRLALRQ